MHLTNEQLFWLGVGAFALIFLAWFFYDCFHNAKDMPEFRYNIDGRNFFTIEEARRYYCKHVLKGRRGMMVSIFDWESGELIERVRCSEYFKPKENGHSLDTKQRG